MIWSRKNRNENLPAFWQDYTLLFSSKQPEQISDVKFIVLDTETTGFDYKNDRVLSIGALMLQNKAISVNDALEVYIEQSYYDKETAKIHGLLKKGARKCISELAALEQFLSYVGNAVLVAHHAFFDINMINTALKRQGLPKLKNKVLDTSTLYKRTLLTTPLLRKKDSYTLDELCEKFSISKTDRHTALGDAYITAIAFLKIIDRLKLEKTKHLF